MNCIIYARYSSAEQRRGSSLARQLEDCRAFAKRKGWSLAEDREYLDEGRSAFSAANREAGSKLHQIEEMARLGLLKDHVMVVERLDRISRQEPAIVFALLSALTQSGLSVATVDGERVYEANKQIDFAGLIEVIVKAKLAHEESEKKSQRVRRARDKALDRARAGDRRAITKQCPAWIRVDEATRNFVLIEDRAGIVRQIFRWAAEGFGTPKIVRMLNESSVPTFKWNNRKQADGWALSTVTKILTHPASIGEYQPLHRPRDLTASKARKAGGVIRDFYPAAVSADLFAQVQAARAVRRGTGGRRGREQHNVLSGLLTCSVCGGRMAYTSSRKAGRLTRGQSGSRKPITYIAKTDASYLLCDRARRGLNCHNKTRIRYEPLERAVLDCVLSLALDDSHFALSDGCAKLRVRIADGERALAEDRASLANFAAMYGRTGSPTAESNMLALEAKIDQAECEQEHLRAELERMSGQVSPEEHRQRVGALRDAMSDADTDIRFAARVRVHQALRSILWKGKCDEQGKAVIFALGGSAAFSIRDGDAFGSFGPLDMIASGDTAMRDAVTGGDALKGATIDSMVRRRGKVPQPA